MDNKVCSGPCGQEKPLTEEFFAPKNRDRETWVGKCKECTSTYNRERYASDPELRRKTRAAAKISNKKTRVITTTYVNEYKLSHNCEDCGEQNPIVLDFHHTGEQPKKGSISRLVQDFYNLKTIKIEIAKCVIVCANCHRKRHALIR